MELSAGQGLNTNYCQQSQVLWAERLACCGPLEGKLAIQETNTAFGPRTEVMCTGPALVRKALAFREATAPASGPGSRLAEPSTWADFGKRSKQNSCSDYNLVNGVRGMGSPPAGWPGCPGPIISTWEAQLGPPCSL
ncbi:unnamed protein product [Pipistrellus nathusii]|uniref:Uncharacterized protein n=1 Tax=Pipistrellus nathusii TaxID=59473 RepID=A0ABN9ZRI2_PIPNA